MSDVSAPAAPSAPATSAPAAQVAPGPSKGPAPAAKPSVGGQVAPKAPAVTSDKAPGETKAEAAARRKYEFKINGKSEVREFTPEEEHIHMQKGLAADRAFQEVAKQKKQIQELIAAGQDKQKLGEVVKQIWGIDLDEYAEENLAKKFQRSTLSEDERKALELREENERYKKQLEGIETEKKTTAQRQYEEKVWAETDRDILKALNDSGLEKNRETLHLIADVVESALSHGIELTPAQMVAEARSRATNFAKGTLFKLDGASLLDALGPEVVNKVLQAEVAKRRGSVTAPQVQPAAPPAPARIRTPASPPRPPEEKEISSTKRRVNFRFGL